MPFLVERNFAEEIDPEASEQLYESAKKLIYVNRYELNSVARSRCIKYYGATCIACGFDFEKMYGEVGRDVIHVHHLKPLSEIGKNYRVDPIRDLCPVCPNCHVMIHKRNPAYSIDEIVTMIKDAVSRNVLAHLQIPTNQRKVSPEKYPSQASESNRREGSQPMFLPVAQAWMEPRTSYDG